MFIGRQKVIINIDSKISPCSECCILPFGWIPVVWILCVHVSEQCVPSEFCADVSDILFNPNFMCRRFGFSVSSYLYVQTFRKLCFILCADVSEILFHPNFMCRRFGNSVSSYLYVQTFRKLCLILNLCADVSEILFHPNFMGRRFGYSVSS
jgi:hypothetical protein